MSARVLLSKRLNARLHNFNTNNTTGALLFDIVCHMTQQDLHQQRIINPYAKTAVRHFQI